ncbi:MAG TPA: glycosyltransferase family 87 protein [Puia sp.]|jgi:hypothetical protein
MRYLKSPLTPIAVISFMFILFQWRTIALMPGSGTDFSIYYHAAGSFDSPGAQLYSTKTTSFDQYLYPPPCILLFRFFHLFPERTAYLLFTLTMYACLIAALILALSLSKINPAKTLPLLLFALASAPVYHQVSLGQINSLVLLLSLLYLHFLQKNSALSGALLALAIWIKLYPILLIIPAFLSPQGRRSILFCALSGLILPLLCLPWIPLHFYRDFANILSTLSQYTSAHIINQSFTAFYMRARLSFDQAFQWPNVYWVPAWLRVVNYLLLAFVILLAAIQTYRYRAFHLAGFLLLAASAVFSPLGWGHTFVLCLPLWILCLEKLDTSSRGSLPAYGLFIVTCLLLLIPVYNHPVFSDHWPAPLRALYYSRFFFITVFLILFAGYPFAKGNLTRD